MPLKELLDILSLQSPQQHILPKYIEVASYYFETLILSLMIVSILWLICISISLTLGSADAFRGVIRRKLSTEKLKEMAKTDSIRGSFRESFRSTSEFLDDLSPPFRLELQDERNESIHSPDVTHFLFLMHGHRGQSKDLAYMQTVMKRIAATKKKRLSRAAAKEKRKERMAWSPKGPKPVKHDMVVHSAVCNEHKTEDGIQNGGDRLVEEMRQVIQDEINKRHPNSKDVFDITISILGNSLGGLYGRYAIAKLVERHCVKEGKGSDSCWILDGRYRLHLNVFCTTATPHLGVSKHTFLPIPRTAEIAAATIMKDTGKDLFRMNDLLHTMATCPTYLRPLSSFRKRIAYANAFNTDFPVPTATAAFLSENSTYPHYFEDESLSIVEPEKRPISPKRKRSPRKSISPDRVKKKLFVASLYTRTMDETREKKSNDMQPEDEERHKDEFHHMSECLDQLGWKKVFIDIRSELPSVEIPKRLIKKRKETSKEPTGGGESPPRCIHKLKRQRKSLPSRDLASAVAQANDNRVSWPLGHNMIVAFSRTRMSTLMNRGGRPVVDAVATELVEDIFAWNGQYKK